MSHKNPRADWTLLAIAAAEGESLSPVQLQKVLFLFGKQMPGAAKNFYHFRPYNYGPFDAAIYSDATELAANGLITVAEQEGRNWSDYSATVAGLKKAKELKAALPHGSSEYMHSLVRWVRSLAFRDLLRAVYAKYPDYAVNSVFRG